MSKKQGPFINTTMKVLDNDNETFLVEVDSDGCVMITAPCGNDVTLRAGRKGKFFRDMLKTYETCAKAAGVYDTNKETIIEKEDTDEDPNDERECCGTCNEVFDLCDCE